MDLDRTTAVLGHCRLRLGSRIWQCAPSAIRTRLAEEEHWATEVARIEMSQTWKLVTRGLVFQRRCTDIDV